METKEKKKFFKSCLITGIQTGNGKIIYESYENQWYQHYNLASVALMYFCLIFTYFLMISVVFTNCNVWESFCQEMHCSSRNALNFCISWGTVHFLNTAINALIYSISYK